MSDDVRVLVVDDSALMRNLISKMITETPGLTVAETAMNGKFALQKIETVKPEVICLDIEMPEMNGIEFLRERKRRGITIPVIILSSIAEKGAVVTMEALALGASDFIQKPGGSISTDIATVKDVLTPMLQGYGSRYKRLAAKSAGTEPAVKKPSLGLEGMLSSAEKPKPITPIRKPGNTEIIAIGISTGGPDALRVVFSRLDPTLKVPILVVQHMPAGFTSEFAKSLDKICPLDVKEAAEGDEVLPGRILIAQGAHHLEVEKRGAGGAIVHLPSTPAVSGHKPSADVLFASVAMSYRNHALGVIMTGMGRDGAQQLGNIYKEGGLTLGQDEATAVVYGMPRVAFELGHVMEQVPLEKMGQRISQVAQTQR
jgi:two-component system chemotaxis response regulator CheB